MYSVKGAALVVAIAGMAVAGCGSTGSSSSSAGKVTTQTVTASSTVAAPVKVAKPKPISNRVKAIAVCAKGKAEIAKFQVDFKPVDAEITANPESEPSTAKVSADITQVSNALDTLDTLATSPLDHTRINGELQGLGHMQAAFDDISSGQIVAASGQVDQGVAAITGYGNQKLAICS